VFEAEFFAGQTSCSATVLPEGECVFTMSVASANVCVVHSGRVLLVGKIMNAIHGQDGKLARQKGMS